jgi:hypothetical protein
MADGTTRIKFRHHSHKPLTPISLPRDRPFVPIFHGDVRNAGNAAIVNSRRPIAHGPLRDRTLAPCCVAQIGRDWQGRIQHQFLEDSEG